MPTIRSLAGADLHDLHEVFLEAFSDYEVKTDLPFSSFETMLRRTGMRPQSSVGAYEGDAMTGFIFNAVREWDGMPTAYDSGTAVIPRCRRQGLTTRMFAEACAVLKKDGVRQYLLEVIAVNRPALELYRRLGFEITRDFNCYRRERGAQTSKAAAPPCSIEQKSFFTQAQWDELKTFWDIEPSWQNGVDSVSAVPEQFIFLQANAGGRVAGYGIVSRNTGDIPQLAVKKDCRRLGVGSALLDGMAALVPGSGRGPGGKLAVLNVDTRCEAFERFLPKHGFTLTAAQHEMRLKFCQ